MFKLIYAVATSTPLSMNSTNLQCSF